MRVAAIDCGTNTVLMLVADYRPEQTPRLQAVADFLELPRLGQDLDRTGRLAEAAMERTLAALLLQAERAQRLGAERVLAVATESVRAAANGAEFLRRVEAAGVPLRVISGDDEARLSFRAASASLPQPAGGVFSVLDIGGGSTELIVGRERPETWRSVPIGSVRLTERHVRSDPPTAAERAALIETVQAAIAALPVAQGPLVAVAGTATTLGAIHLGLATYDGKRIDGMVLPTAALAEIVERLGSLTLAERKQIAGLDPRRADVAYAGSVILWQVALRARVSEITISDRGVRWGVLEELAAGAG